ncbi:hypothetical protein HPP92_013030 [Vanilla planifolia]|uniref:Uncharacterized protein n=1 Tax=Vanilla planifolia TaxID=51239 RepID=A0A835QRL6_VANPL|nr:hypothetical protein HPP92_013030 [Vanilla planifolia]
MDELTNDNESRSTSSFPDDPPSKGALEEETKEEEMGVQPRSYRPVTRSSSSSVPPSPNQ